MDTLEIEADVGAIFGKLFQTDKASLLGKASLRTGGLAAGLVPAADCLQSQRARVLMMRKLAEATASVDVYLAPAPAWPEPDATEIVVLVPALASTVEALTGDVDDRRADAERTASSLASGLRNARGEVGADDPVLAVEDALRTFGADEIVVVGDDDGVVDAIRAKVAVPVSRA